MIAQNLKYLRQKFNFSQQELAEKLDIPRSSISDYERAYTQMPLDTLLKLCNVFNISIDHMVKSLLAHKDLEVARNNELRVLAISVDAHNRNNIELVDTKAEAGYLDSFADPEYIKELPKLYIPSIPEGTFRAFEIRGDSMLPLESGSIVICQYVEKFRDIKDNRTYVIITKNEGLVYKRIRIDNKENRLLLVSDNDAYLPYHLAYADVAELWQYYAHISFSDTKFTFNYLLEEKLHDMQRKITELHKKLI